jgi:anaerobic dimethyl sulfoxide reductase subunit C (anchor subunit)
MNFREWPLVLFTLLFQAAAGTATVFWVLAALGRSDAAGQVPAIVIFLPAVLSAVLSLFHLGRPFRAPRSILNLGRSWLSREILLLLTFEAAAAAMVLDEPLGLQAGGAFRLVAALSGPACILMMSKIYTLPAVPDWNSWRTPASFFSSALVLGGLTAGLVIGGLEAPVLILLAAAFVFNLIFAPRFGLAGRRATPLGFRPNSAWPAIFAVRSILFAAAILFWLTALILPEAASWLEWAAFSSAVISEIIGRLQFYDIPLGLSPRKS